MYFDIGSEGDNFSLLTEVGTERNHNLPNCQIDIRHGRQTDRQTDTGDRKADTGGRQAGRQTDTHGRQTDTRDRQWRQSDEQTQ